jgi:hypothetical protein
VSEASGLIATNPVTDLKAAQAPGIARKVAARLRTGRSRRPSFWNEDDVAASARLPPLTDVGGVGCW